MSLRLAHRPARDTPVSPRTRVPVGSKLVAELNAGDVDADREICDQPDDGVSWEESLYAKQVAALLASDELNQPGTRYVFTGHSLGGVLPLLAAKQKPDSCAIVFGACGMKGGWQATLGDAVERTLNIFNASDPFLPVYNNPIYRCTHSIGIGCPALGEPRVVAL